MKTLTEEQQIEQAINDVKEAMTADLKAKRSVTESQILQKKTHNDLIMANARLRGLQQDLNDSPVTL